jgi:hypothetical protein
MRSVRIPHAIVLAVFLIVPSAAVAGGLESFLDDIEVRAGADRGAYKADLRLTFDVSEGEVNGLFEVMARSSDVYMCLRIGELTDAPIDRVVDEYRRHQGQGWGVIAKNLGIKPGSDEFHALKAGRLPDRNGSSGGNGSKNKNKNGKGKK